MPNERTPVAVSTPVQSFRQRLIRCLRSGSRQDWEEVLAVLEGPVSRTLGRHAFLTSGSTRQELDDLLQEFFLHLCAERHRVIPALERLRDDEALPYVRTIAANLARDRHRRDHSMKRGAGVTAVAVPDAGDLRDHNPQPDKRLLYLDVEHCLKRHNVAAEQVQIFWSYYRDGYTAEEISRWLATALSAKGVESLLLRLRKVIKDCLSAKRAVGAQPHEGNPGASALTGEEWENG